MANPNVAPDCLLCDFDPANPDHGVMLQDKHAYLRTDPWSPPENLNAIVVPLRHEGDFLNLRLEELLAIRSLAHAYRDLILVTHGSADFNLGADIGQAAGQLGDNHTYWMLAPRFEGDMDAEGRTVKGGVRWIIPEMGDYTASTGPGTPGEVVAPLQNPGEIPAS